MRVPRLFVPMEPRRHVQGRDISCRTLLGQTDRHGRRPGRAPLDVEQCSLRNGVFDFSALEAVLCEEMNTLKAFRDRDIRSFVDEDKESIEGLFDAFLVALKIADGKKKGTKSPVAGGEKR